MKLRHRRLRLGRVEKFQIGFRDLTATRRLAGGRKRRKHSFPRAPYSISSIGPPDRKRRCRSQDRRRAISFAHHRARAPRFDEIVRSGRQAASLSPCGRPARPAEKSFACLSRRTRTTIPSRINRTIGSSASERPFQASQTPLALRQTGFPCPSPRRRRIKPRAPGAPGACWSRQNRRRRLARRRVCCAVHDDALPTTRRSLTKATA